jgi:hypothetical protein
MLTVARSDSSSAFTEAVISNEKLELEHVNLQGFSV